MGGICFLPHSGFKFTELEIADGDADETQGRVADGGGHAAHLPVLSFREGEGDPAVRDAGPDADGWIAWRDGWLGVREMGACRPASMPLDVERAVRQFGECLRIGDALDLGEVGFRLFRAGIEESVDEGFLIGKQKESLGIHVETSDWPNILGEAEVREGLLAGLVLGELAEHPVRFVEDDQHRGRLTPTKGNINPDSKHQSGRCFVRILRFGEMGSGVVFPQDGNAKKDCEVVPGARAFGGRIHDALGDGVVWW